MSLLSHIARNASYQAFSKFFGAIIGLLTVALMTRYLGQTGYGYYTTIVAFLQFFGVLADFGLQMTTTKMLSEPGTDNNKIFGNIFTLRILSSILFLGSSVLIVWLLPYPLLIKEGISIASLSFFFISLQSIFVSIFQKNIAMARVALAEILTRSVALLGIWLSVYNDLGLLLIIASIVCGNAISFGILFFSSAKYLKLRPEINLAIWKKIWSATWPLALTIALTLIYFRADTVILSLFRPQSEVGIYGATYKVLEVLVQFPYLFLGLILPLLTSFFVSNRKIFELIIQKGFDFLIIIVMPMIFSILFLGEKIMVFIAGPEFIISGALLKILIFATALIYIGALFGYAIVAAGLPKKMIKFYFIDAVISLVLYLIFIPIFSYWAAAYITILTELIITWSSYYVLKKYTRIKINPKIIYKSLGASLIMSIFLFVLINQNLMTLVIVGVLIYFWALYILKGFSKKMVLEIINPLKK
ncbi:MAG: flippase [Candidatus Buchananbacteria bacterium]|nr:flippase [Candidatus Buchananbacteria bacterium]